MKVNIIGSGLAGLSAALTLAEKNIEANLISLQSSERAQSNLAEGGINAVLDVMGENDTVEEHFDDTIKSGCMLADPEMVMGLVKTAPYIVRQLDAAGVPFNRADGHMIERSFGGQKKKRTAFAKSSSGKMIMTAMVDAARRYEINGLIERYPHHRFERLVLHQGKCVGVQVLDTYSGDSRIFKGPVIMACGGMNGLFYGRTTGTTANSGTVAAELFSQGVRFANLEFVQYHPTTVAIEGKRMLISEAARGEGGRLFYEENDKKIYFMEDMFGERGNLMPRDVVSREMVKTGKQIYLDMTGIPQEIWRNNLSDLRDEIIHYMHTDPVSVPVQVSPGIHYFMGGILADRGHRTNIFGLYAAGECACAYHGANRLGGNSMLGAIYGGHVAAETSATEIGEIDNADSAETVERYSYMTEGELVSETAMEEALFKGMSVMRNEKDISNAIEEIISLREGIRSDEGLHRLFLTEAMLRSALERRETRGAHVRTDYPETSDDMRKLTIAEFNDDRIFVSFKESCM